MKNDGSKPVSPDAVRKAEREARLAEQLRANLKRRKAAARSEAGRQKADGEENHENPQEQTAEQSKNAKDGTSI